MSTTTMNVVFTAAPSRASSPYTDKLHGQTQPFYSCFSRYASLSGNSRQFTVLKRRRDDRRFTVSSCLLSSDSTSSPSPSASSIPKTKLFVSGLSFRTTEESLRNAFQNFGQLVEVNLVMDKIAQRPRGFAFIRYATEDESQKAIEGMHGKFLDGRVIFVEVAKPRSELRQGQKNNQRQF